MGIKARDFLCKAFSGVWAEVPHKAGKILRSGDNIVDLRAPAKFPLSPQLDLGYIIYCASWGDIAHLYLNVVKGAK